MNSYKNPQTAKEYGEFLSTENGKLERQFVLEAIKKKLSPYSKQNILDAGCGQGWLAFELNKLGHKVSACDFSESLISEARELYPEIEFKTADLTNLLPYPEDSFDIIVSNMVAHDVQDLDAYYENLVKVLKPNGLLVLTIANPYYAFPVGVWKRGILGKILNRMPQLKIRSYNSLKKQARQFTWNKKFTAFFYPLEEQIKKALASGFVLEDYSDLFSDEDSPKFNAKYQLYRVPTILLLAFKKNS